MLVMLLGTLCVSWVDKLIGVATDGERTNMGHITGIQKQLVDLVMHDMTQVNCVNHQAASQSGDPFVLVLFKCFYNTFTRCPRFSALFV